MQQTISILNTKVHPKWEKNWKLKSFAVSVSVVRNTSLSFATETKTEMKKKKKKKKVVLQSISTMKM